MQDFAQILLKQEPIGVPKSGITIYVLEKMQVRTKLSEDCTQMFKPMLQLGCKY